MSPQFTRCFEDVFLFEPNTVLCLWEGKDKESEKTMNIYGILLEKKKQFEFIAYLKKVTKTLTICNL